MRYAMLEPCRGFAALWVLSFHYVWSTSFVSHFPLLAQVARRGDLGVAMFFVISGFCITASARSSIAKSEPVGGFLYRRARRIYPPYWLSIAVVATIPFIMSAISSVKVHHYVPPDATNYNYGYIHFDFLHWLRIGTLAQVFASVPNATDLSYKFTDLNAVYWTLAIEVQFYAVVALALMYRKYFYSILIAVTAISIPFALVSSTYMWGIFFSYWPMFAMGVLLYWLLERGHTPMKLFGGGAAAVSALAGAGLIAAFCVYTASGGQTDRFLFSALFAVFLFFFFVFDEPAARGADRYLITRGAMWLAMALGAMSYSLYLIHGRLIPLVAQVLRQVVPSNTLLYDAVLVTATCTICYAFYWVCERPFATTRKKELSGAFEFSRRSSPDQEACQ